MNSSNNNKLISLPSEIKISIFKQLSNQDLTSLFQTCKSFYDFLEPSSEFWRDLFAYRYLPTTNNLHQTAALQPSNPYFLCRQPVFDCNLFQPRSWIVTSGQWTTESEPVAPRYTSGIVYPDPNGVCDVTSYMMGERSWVLRLLDIGVEPSLVDTGRIVVRASEWHVARDDCGSQYFLAIETFGDVLAPFPTDNYTPSRFAELLSLPEIAGPLASVSSGLLECPQSDKPNEYPWRRHELELRLPVGTRLIVVKDGGKDTRFWAGFYGPKICSTCITLSVI